MKNNKFVSLVLIPGFAMLFIFVVIPVIYGLTISFFDYNPARDQNIFLGFENYIKLFHDPVFKKATVNTLIFGIVAVFLNIVITLFLAQIISSLPWEKWRILFRTLLFIPCIAPAVGTALIWKTGIIEPDGGLLNNIMGLLGLSPKNWLMSPHALFIIIIIYTLWADIGYNIILFSAGLENVPAEIEEAAAIDGANAVQRFFMVKVPLIGRTFAFVAVMTMANYFQMFAQFQVIAPNGGYDNSAMVLTNYIYRQSFTNYDMGYASAIAMALFLIVFSVAMVQNRMMRADWSYE